VRDKGMVFGYGCGVRWEAGVDQACLRAIQRHFEDESATPKKRVFLTAHYGSTGGASGTAGLRPDADRY